MIARRERLATETGCTSGPRCESSQEGPAGPDVPEISGFQRGRFSLPSLP